MSNSQHERSREQNMKRDQDKSKRILISSSKQDKENTPKVQDTKEIFIPTNTEVKKENDSSSRADGWWVSTWCSSASASRPCLIDNAKDSEDLNKTIEDPKNSMYILLTDYIFLRIFFSFIQFFKSSSNLSCNIYTPLNIHFIYKKAKNIVLPFTFNYFFKIFFFLLLLIFSFL